MMLASGRPSKSQRIGRPGRFVIVRRLLLTGLFLLLAAARPMRAQGCTGVTNSTVGVVMWAPQWCQEFSGAAGSPDTTAWSFDLGNNNGWGNQELEVYCGPPGYMNNPSQCPTTFSTTTNTVYLDGSGHLVIQPIFANGTWISTRINTQGTKNFQYGRIEASIQLPDTTNPGLWPAFWSLGSSFPATSWPNCGEADIMENWSPSVLSGPGPNGNRSTIHTAKTAGLGKGAPFTFPSGQQANTAFHTYGVIWSTNMMQYYVDTPANPFFIVTPSDLASSDTWPFNARIFLLANVAVGGTLGGSTANLVNPQPTTFDYVRQYTASPVPAPTLGNAPSITIKAGATTGNTSTFTPTLTAGTGFVYFSCGTTAPNATCAVSTTDKLNSHVVNSAMAGESVTVAVTTMANAGAPLLFHRLTMRFWLPIAMLGVLLCAFAAFALRRRFGWLSACAATGIILVISLMGACGGGSYNPSPAPPAGGTTPGGYQITVKAFTESNTNGIADANAQITLTVN